MARRPGEFSAQWSLKTIRQKCDHRADNPHNAQNNKPTQINVLTASHGHALCGQLWRCGWMQLGRDYQAMTENLICRRHQSCGDQNADADESAF